MRNATNHQGLFLLNLPFAWRNQASGLNQIGLAYDGQMYVYIVEKFIGAIVGTRQCGWLMMSQSTCANMFVQMP